MSILTGSHSAQSVVCTIDGLRIVGLWEGDDAINVSQSNDEGEFMIGADASGIWSEMPDESAEITIKLQPTSSAHRQLLGLRARQKAGILRPFSFTASNVSTGEVGTSLECFVKRKADNSQGDKAAVREWTIAAFRWEES